MRFSVRGLHHRLLIPDEAKIVSAGTVEHYSVGLALLRGTEADGG
jgi:hypothetical protein